MTATGSTLMNNSITALASLPSVPSTTLTFFFVVLMIFAQLNICFGWLLVPREGDFVQLPSYTIMARVDILKPQILEKPERMRLCSGEHPDKKHNRDYQRADEFVL